jgi:hypothetical protein
VATTDIVVIEASGFVALNSDLDEVAALIEENLGGQEVTEFDLTRLSVPSGKAAKYRWELPTLEGSDVVDEVSGIIVSQKASRGYWPLSIDAGGGGNPPVCSSPDGRIGFGKQWATKADPDPEGEPVALKCADCPLSKFGTDEQGRGQACKQSSSLFLIMETGFLPAVVSVPPTSLAAIRKYMFRLSNAGIRYDQVVTTFGLEKASNSGGTEYAEIAPRMGGRLDPDAHERAKAYGAMLAPTFERVAREQAAAAMAAMGDPPPAPAPASAE